MKPVTPVIPGLELPVKTYAKDQPPYQPLPCFASRDINDTITIRWQLTWAERFAVLFGGSIWHQILTFGHKLQPVMLFTACPLDEDALRAELLSREMDDESDLTKETLHDDSE